MQMYKKIGYALGDMGISLSYFAVGFFFMYYLTDIVGMSPFLAGLAFFIGKLWDGINDPLMGILSDRTKSRFGRKRVYILFGAFPLAVVMKAQVGVLHAKLRISCEPFDEEANGIVRHLPGRTVVSVRVCPSASLSLAATAAGWLGRCILIR